MNDEIRLAIIYEKNDDNNYSFYCPTFVRYNSEDNYKVLTGDLSSSTETVFSKINSVPDFIFGDKQYMDIFDTDYEKTFAIYIFTSEFINKYSNTYCLSRKNAIYDIIRYANDIDLVFDAKEECYCAVSTKIKNMLTDELIEDKLYKMGPATISSSDSEVLGNYIEEVIHQTQHQLERSIEHQKAMEANPKIDINPNKVKDIIDIIDRKIIGQERAIKTLVSNIYFNQKLIDYLDEIPESDRISELDSRKQAILLDGSTGTGKTAILKEIASKMGLPLVIANANSFSETGYVGPTITDILEKLIDEANGNIKLAERGIIVLDEIDKIAENDNTYRSMKLGVQEELLGFISGSTYELKSNQSFFSKKVVSFDTSKITFILSGAFTSLKEEKIKENNTNSLGFSSIKDSEKKKVYTVTPYDYVKYGLKKEFFGRVKIITTTKTYLEEDLKNILLYSEISPLKSFEKTCIMLGYKGISYTDEFIDEVVKEAYIMSTGARSLQTIISGIQDIMLYDLLTHKIDSNSIINLDTYLLNKYKKNKVRTY